MLDHVTLYRKSANGKLQVWTISVDDEGLLIEWGDEDGEQQTKEELVDVGLAGRTVEEQLRSQMISRINKKLDIGYTEDRDDALLFAPTNSLGLKRPMLALPYDKAKNIELATCFSQYKYDGHRCLVHIDDDGEVTPYSRRGKPIETIDHITAMIKELELDSGVTLDGELYIHRTALQTITSYVKRHQRESRQLNYIVYDIIMEGVGFRDRYAYLCEKFENFQINGRSVTALEYAGGYIYLANTDTSGTSAEKLPHQLNEAIALGYEGLIIRNSIAHYQAGKRNSALVKVKQWLDAEFEITGVVESKDGYGILVCKLPAQTHFRVTAPGNFGQKVDALINKQKYIGRMVTVQFAYRTKENKPFHPVALRYREDV